MAVTLVLPVFRAAGAQSAGTTGATVVAAPAGVATGDLEILAAEVRAADTCSITTNGGSAWTAMSGSPVSVAAGEKLYVWSRVRQAGDSDPSVTPSADHVDAARLAYQVGTFDPQDPFENEVTGTEATVDTSFSFAPGGSTAGNNRLVLVISTILRDSNVASVPICTNAALSNLASRANFCTNSGAGGGFGITEGRLATAAAVGTFACTYAATSAKAYISFAIKPFSTASGSATASAASRTTSTGAKGGTSAATSSAASRTTSTGAKGGTGAATSSAAARATSTGQKNGAGSATASARAQVTATGFGPISLSGSATCSAAARTTVTGAKGASSTASASARAAATSTGAKGGTSAAAASAAAQTTATGAKGGQGAAAASTASHATAAGAKAGSGAGTCSARSQTVATGAKGGQGGAAASSATRTTATGLKGGTSVATASARPQATASGAKAGYSQGSVLTDDFADGSVCTGRWPAANGVSESGGQGVLPFTQDGEWIASTFRTASDKRINDRTFTVEVVRAHSSSAGTFLFGIGRDTGRPFAHIYVAGGNINYEFDDGTFGFDSQPYDPAVHRWWRIREAAGTVYFETSVDGISWTVRKTSIRTREWGLQPLKLWASKNSATAIPDALIDNVSVTETGVHVSAGLRATATGAKGGQGSATVSGRVTVTATGSTAPPPPSGSATASARASASASGFKGGVSSAQASASARTTASGSKSTSGAAGASARARASAAGAKGGVGSASVSIAGSAASSGTSSRAGAASVSVGATVTATAATVTGGTATITAGARVSASGHANTTVPGGQRVHLADRGRVRVVPRDLPTVERGRVD